MAPTPRGSYDAPGRLWWDRWWWDQTMAEPVETRSGRYLELSDDALIKQCDVGCYRARGPGGQKRNKTSSAVRVRHRPTGLQASAVGSRSQHVNKRHAVRRLRRVIALQLRSPIDLESYCPSPLLSEYLTKAGCLAVNVRNQAYYPIVAEVLDVLEAGGLRLSDAAPHLGLSTSQLVKFIEHDGKLWERVNQMRIQAGVKPLR